MGLGEGQYARAKWKEFARERHTWISDYPKWRKAMRVRSACPS